MATATKGPGVQASTRARRCPTSELPAAVPPAPVVSGRLGLQPLLGPSVITNTMVPYYGLIFLLTGSLQPHKGSWCVASAVFTSPESMHHLGYQDPSETEPLIVWNLTFCEQLWPKEWCGYGCSVCNEEAISSSSRGPHTSMAPL